MSQKRYELVRDSHNRLVAELVGGIRAGLRVLAETDQRRMDFGEYAYVVLDIPTAYGPFRLRDVKIMKSKTSSNFFCRWKQWGTGRERHDGRQEYLDIFGPLDSETRRKVEHDILSVFLQVREIGTIGGQNPELARLKAQLEGRDPEAELEPILEEVAPTPQS